MRPELPFRLVALAALALGFAAADLSAADVRPGQVTVRDGPTPISGGTAQATGDITLVNDRMAVAFAVDTLAPWGVPRGGILDIAEVRDGVIGADRASLLDFLPDSWSRWVDVQPEVEVLRDDGSTAIVRTTRSWRGVRIVSDWRLDASSNRLAVVTEMRNGSSAPIESALSGHVLWPEGGFLFGPPGLHGRSEGPAAEALAHWAAAYDEDWLLALHAPYASEVQQEGRDRYLAHSLAPGESRRFEAWLQVERDGSLAPVVAAEIAQGGKASARVGGRVSTRDGAPVAMPAVVAEVLHGGDFVPYAWSLGRDGQYAFELPVGHYRLHATARNHAPSASFDIELGSGANIDLDFTGLLPPGALRVHVLDAASGRPLDARVTVESLQEPVIRTFGHRTFFTELDPAGQVLLSLPPGEHRLRIESAAGFTALPARLDASVTPGGHGVATARIPTLADPAGEGWYGGDMHHHSDVLDGFSEPDFVMRSQLAAGLDVTLLSDHDSVVNNAEMARLAAMRGVPFIAGTELSPSWAHFNAYPLKPGREIGIDTAEATVQEVFAEARRLGADVIQLNHPWLSYGYFHTADAGQVPGGYSDAFDLVEITAADLQANSPTIHRTWELWNVGQRAYFSAGSDAHDVWQDLSGSARMYVKLEGRPDAERYVAALKRGNAYATTGPLVFPEILFGDELRHPAGTPLDLGYRLSSVNGLVSVRLVEGGREIDARHFDPPQQEAGLRFEAWPESDTWYALVAEDAAGRFLVTNPVWVTVEAPAEGR